MTEYLLTIAVSVGKRCRICKDIDPSEVVVVPYDKLCGIRLVLNAKPPGLKRGYKIAAMA